jgi:hypothetical protein
MKWIEIIRLRSAGYAPESLKPFLSHFATNAQPGLIETKAYRHATWETDWSLHLRWDSENPERNGSGLGLRLSQALEQFGLVDRSVWLEDI